jgi:hypothetical protein
LAVAVAVAVAVAWAVAVAVAVVRLPTRNTYLRISDKLLENPFQPGRAPPRKSLLAAPSELRWWTPTKIICKIGMRPVQAK